MIGIYAMVNVSLLANGLDLDDFFLFGGIAKEGNFIKKKTAKELKNYLMPVFKGKIKLNISELIDVNPAILGAAYLAKESSK